MLRSEAYRELFRYQLDPGLVDQIRAATNGNYALGSPKFSAEVEVALGRRVTKKNVVCPLLFRSFLSRGALNWGGQLATART
jgi:hypothetical protein